ncbi:MAG TPA: serine hydrolase domain-containing protein [Tepidisphaeraceae bacterium]|jgi:CubicO group peptidase (beta-lactamase class C family)|nr:serine hydrolase domain-containing protein [Tepidisphaeraceae bacterium]
MMVCRQGILIALFCLLLVGCAESLPFEAASLRKPGDALDAAMQQWMTVQHSPGLAMAIVKDGQLASVRAYGLADVKTRKPVEPDTAFWLASVSKTIIATAIMMLVEEGKLRLDDPVISYLDEKPPAWKGMTLRHLLSHTSGIANILTDTLTVTDLRFLRMPLIQHVFDPEGNHSEQEVLHVLGQQPLLFAPGTSEHYSNSNFVLLGMVIHKVTGKPYDQFLQERIFTPLHMSHTCVYGNTLPDTATGYSWENGRLLLLEQKQPTIDHKGYACGGIVTTAPDLARFDIALASGKLISPATFQLMCTPNVLADGLKSIAGLGFFTGGPADHPWIIHTGGWSSWGGFSSLYQHLLKDHVSIIVLTNQVPMDWSTFPQGSIWSPYLPAPAGAP